MQIKRLSIDKNLCLVNFEINFNVIHGGSSTILIGENGAGKSTVIETILEILMSFDSPAIEQSISYNYELAYIYARKNITIAKSAHRYSITIDNVKYEGSFKTICKKLKENRIFPQRIVSFYSGSNNKIQSRILKLNSNYKKVCRATLKQFLQVINDDNETFLPVFPKRKYNYCDENLMPIYLASILCGPDSFEKEYLINACNISHVEQIYMNLNINKVEGIFGRGKFNNGIPIGLYYLCDFIDERFTDALRSGFVYSEKGRSYFKIANLEELKVDSISILEFFEKLQSLFDAQYEITVAQGSSNVKCSNMSEEQRQLVKILGMLGICKSEDCLVLMDEPDAHMNPRWKYEIKTTIDKSLLGANDTQAIIATHDPLVINGVSKEYIRILEYNKADINNEMVLCTKVIEPTQDTEGMGIDGLLQSEYYGMPSVLDSETRNKLYKKHGLLVKKNDGTITETELQNLIELTEELENMMFSRNIPMDVYYDEYVAAMHKIYSERPKVKLTAEDIAERNAKAEEILKGLLGK